MPPYESTIGNSDLKLGQEYFGSTVTKVKQDVTTAITEDDVEVYIVKRSVTLKNGVTMNEKYQREKSLGEIKSRTYGDRNSSNSEEPKKKRRPKKSKSLGNNSERTLPSSRKSPRTRKKRSKSIGNGGPQIEPWFNFDEVKTPEPPSRPKRRPVPKPVEDETPFFETPYDPFPAVVVSESLAPSVQSKPVIGVWKHPDQQSDSHNDDDKEMEVVVSKLPPVSLKTEEPHGIVCIADRLNPKSVGKIRPDQLKFLRPGQDPPPFFKKVGHWRPKKWKKSKGVGKIKLEEVFHEKIPEMAIVYPRNDAPDCHDKDKEIIIAKGTWKFQDDKASPEGADTWVPTYVQLDLDGMVHVCEDESNNDADDGNPCGVWGVNPNDDANAANPSDLWFYPPDEEMDDGFQPIGKWKMLKESLWPPKSIGHVVDKRQFKQYRGSLNNVGKLKMPAFFSGK